MMARAFILFLLCSKLVSAQVEIDRRSISPLVSAVDLNVPPKARKELVEANKFIAKENWTKTIEKLQHALTIYPDYAVAYNNLAVAYAHIGDQMREREALEKAIRIDDHMSLAYLNLARMNISVSDFPHAENLLLKASSLDPTDAVSLILLAYSELMNQHLDEAIATCRKAHSTQQYAHAFAHRVAARVFEQRNQVAEAIAELQLFLNEEQPGPSAEGARKELLMLQSLEHRFLPTTAESYQRFCKPDRCVVP